MQNSFDYFSAIRRLAHASPDKEICGFLLMDGRQSLELLEAVNEDKQPERFFRIGDRQHLAARKTGRLFGVYHTHTQNGLPTLSKLDMHYAGLNRLPYLMYALATDTFDYYRPLACIPPYENRGYVRGVQCCSSLVTDWYEKEWGLKIPFVASTPDVVRLGMMHIPEICSSVGFRTVTGDPKQGDLLMFDVGEGRYNHVAVYLGDGNMLHQMESRPSIIEVYTPNWKRRLSRHMRHDNA